MASMIKSVDFHCASNNAAHRTDDVTTKQLMVRRGQSFLLTLNMTQAFSASDKLVLTAETGAFPSEKRGTRSEFGNPPPAYSGGVKAIWKSRIDERANLQRGAVTLAVTPPADAPVGKYALSAATQAERRALGSLVVLFNPWCSDDCVFLPDEKERQEYVMNEHGLIYVGQGDWPMARDWVFGQFEEEMVDICLKILDVNPKHLNDPADDTSARCSPVYVGRVISAMINCNGDKGVLAGKWDGNYGGGENPSSWVDSVSILRRWYKTHCRPVKYGQCWVYAGVMCTVMRFFGIPCRVVTNFQSAHDTNSNLTIDQYYGENGVQPKKSRDSIWNFHVWVEGWMKRPDLKKGDTFDGWQVLDPTPQEKSEGEFCCGPASVTAIKQGDTNLKYDLPFVFAEVNADVVSWMVSANGSKTKMHSDTRSVGRSISTKAVGSNARNDITHTYKWREGSREEREAFNRAVGKLNSKVDPVDDSVKEKVEMKFEKDPNVQSGEDVNLKLRLRNKEYTKKTISIIINAQVMKHNGDPAAHILNALQEKTLASGQEVIVPIQIPFHACSSDGVDCDCVKVSALAFDKDSSEIYHSETDISFQQPSISLKVVGDAHLYSKLTMQVEFTNPLNVTVRDCSLTISGSGLTRFDYMDRKIKDLKPKTTLRFTVTTTPFKLGSRIVVARLSCSAFRNITGSCMVHVKP